MPKSPRMSKKDAAKKQRAEERRDPATGLTKAEMEADIARMMTHIDRLLDERQARTHQLLETVSRTGG